jgi:flavin reductase (DIM6/NTAB) family NADH-FMN oxidoreductase RutF
MIQTALAPAQVGVSPLDLRRACEQFATGVTIVTVRDGDGARGMTANSFTSVSLDPPLILISIDVRNRTHALVSEQGRFAVNMLAREQRAWSDQFAGRHGDPQDRLDDVPHHLVDGLPAIDGAAAVLICEVTAVYPARDHSLFVGEVKRLEWSPDREPLLFHSGQYHGLDSAETVEFHEMAC